jgi:alpha-galactosidase
MPSSITVTPNLAFALSAPQVEYRFHVDPRGDLVHDHFGSPCPDMPPINDPPPLGWGPGIYHARREFPDHGRGDFRLPAIRVRRDGGQGHAVTHFVYDSHEVVAAKPPLPGLPATFGDEEDVSTLLIRLVDKRAQLSVELSYSIFAKNNAITRSFAITNNGEETVVLERAASLSLDMVLEEWDWEMVQLCGDWAREGRRERRKVQFGTQGWVLRFCYFPIFDRNRFQSSTGYSSHYHNPFVSLVAPWTDETHGPAYGFSLVYTGSFSVDIEKTSPGRARVMLSLNPLHLSWPLSRGKTFHTPEVCSVYEPTNGLGGMSRSFHRLYRHHLSRSEWTHRTRPVLINNWEATYFDFNADKLYRLGKDAADLGVKMFVMDDGWFGVKHPRTSDRSGLGDWVPNPDRFPNGLGAFVKKITALLPKGIERKMMFGIWVEPEMVNPDSELYEQHPDWVLHADDYPRTVQRNQLVLDLGNVDVQDYIVDCISTLLSSATIGYVKWDNNRGMHEVPYPSSPHLYILGLYRVLSTLTSRFPHVLFEGCASGGGRFDPGILFYWPQSWTSDDTDALERLFIQFGTTLVYPASSMGCHVSKCPNDQVGRTTPFMFRAHVAMMGGSFGFELDPADLSESEREMIPSIVKLAERVNPFVIKGDMYRLAIPEESNWPAVLYLTEDGETGVVLAFQVQAVPQSLPTPLRLQGLRSESWYEIKGEGKDKGEVYAGSMLMHVGLRLQWHGDYDSKVLWVAKTKSPNSAV